MILGAGAAGLSLASRLSRRLEGAAITIVDPRQNHYYQPGFTLVAAGLKPAEYAVSSTAHWVPRGVDWIAEAAASIDPEARVVETAGGQRIDYDILVLATGLTLDWNAIEGFSLDLVGREGIGALYAGPDYAVKTWAAMDRFTEEGGEAVITPYTVGAFHS